MLALPEVVATLGANPDALLAEVGLSRAYFQDPENSLDVRTIGRLFGRAQDATGCRQLGLLMGQRTTMSFMGAVGFLMKSSPTVGDAWRALASHLAVHDRGSIATVEVGPRFTTIGYAVQVPDVEAVEQLYSLAIAIGHNMMREMCGDDWRAEEVQFSFDAHEPQAFRQFFRCPVLFNAERSCLIISTASLAQRLRTADPLLHRMMSERIRTLTVEGPASLLEQARQQLATMVFQPDCTAAVLANRLGLSQRTLFRRLASESATFQELRDEALRNTAFEMLAHTNKRAVDVAILLGYSDPAAFTRAFRRWTGITPRKWRAVNRADDRRGRRATPVVI